MTGRLRFAVPAALFAVLATVMAIFILDVQSGRINPREVPSPLIGKPVPAFALTPPKGLSRGLSSADLKGRITVVNVFASWCLPCLAEHPIVTRLSQDKSIAVVGINYKDKDKDAVAWLKEHGNPYARVGADRDGRAAIDWGLTGVPETFIVDRAAIIRYVHRGPMTPDILKRRILPVIEKLKAEPKA